MVLKEPFYCLNLDPTVLTVFIMGRLPAPGPVKDGVLLWKLSIVCLPFDDPIVARLFCPFYYIKNDVNKLHV